AYTLGAGAPAGATIDASTGAFSWTPAAAGVYPVTIRATDNGTPPRSATEMIFITVGDPTNRAPVLAAIGNRTIDESVRAVFTAIATDPDYGQTRTFTLDAGAPAGASINPLTGVFIWTPTDAQGPGSYPVTVRVTDNGTPPLSDFEAITITVHDVNAAPVLALIGSKTVLPMVALTFTASATDPDIPVNTLTFSLDAGEPAGATIDPTSGAFSWTPTAAGTYPVTIRVTDDGTPPLSDFEGITITVSAQATATILRPNYPNPFSAGTRIDYRLQYNAHVRLALYDIHGREVKVLVDEDQSAGDHTAYWDGKGQGRTQAASGVYLCRLAAGSQVLKGTMILAR
ncbi:MAG: putative Ig domain-containing protein, partial [Candidatus Eiseniibacteriota bacterium]